MARLITVGDVHGHNLALQGLLQQINPQPDDEFVFLGDLIDRGPDSAGVLDTCIELAQKCLCTFIMGNHCEMMLAALLGKSEMSYWKKFGGDTAIRSWGHSPVGVDPNNLRDKVPAAHWRLLGNMVDYVERDEHIFVHASYLPSRKLAETGNGVLRWEKLPSNLGPYYGPYGDVKTAWMGHTPHSKVVDRGHLVCIDTGCGVLHHGCLTAVDVHTRTFWHADTTGKPARLG